MSVDLQVGELKGTVDAIKADVMQIKADVRLLLASEDRRKGGWAVISVLGGLIGGFLAKVFP